jgi:hypothetical protein
LHLTLSFQILAPRLNNFHYKREKALEKAFSPSGRFSPLSGRDSEVICLIEPRDQKTVGQQADGQAIAGLLRSGAANQDTVVRDRVQA